jgi:hypothetical protein
LGPGRFRYYRVAITNFNGTFNFSQNATNPFNAGWSYANAILGTFYSYTESQRRVQIVQLDKIAILSSRDLTYVVY